MSRHLLREATRSLQISNSKLKIISQYSSDKTKTLVETAIYRVLKATI
ncbi:hypothetical protein GXM_06085 [Nostoc sphaeroides CCNUC1]|uniref:Uncharacterized protein n=1 Tax=Nostoc sphaeroides CCNUC1 TaxID=2653204 RepID=A0A5P8W7S9_9NOSO|nr:hypothetical protein GXM_06085 [Nostoc sphaeroides CCNUC1]